MKVINYFNEFTKNNKKMQTFIVEINYEKFQIEVEVGSEEYYKLFNTFEPKECNYTDVDDYNYNDYDDCNYTDF